MQGLNLTHSAGHMFDQCLHHCMALHLHQCACPDAGNTYGLLWFRTPGGLAHLHVGLHILHPL